MRVIAGVAEMRSSPPANAATPLRACSIKSFQPPSPSSSRGIGKLSSRPLSGRGSPGTASVTRACGRFHGSLPGIAGRVTAMFRTAPSVTPGAPRGRRYSLPPSLTATALRPLIPVSTRRATITLPACRTPSSSIRASMISPFSISAARTSPMPRSLS